MAYEYILETGVIVADASTIQDEVESEFRSALGDNINLAASTPQGTLSAAEVIARSTTIRQTARMAGVINPNYSFGKYLDDVSALMGIERGSDTPSYYRSVRLEGRPNVLVVAGSRVKSQEGNIFSTVSDVRFSATGVSSVDIVSADMGPVSAALGEMDIIDAVNGWNAAIIVSTTVYAPGSFALTDSQLKAARLRRLAIQGRGSIGAIQAAIESVQSVKSALVIDNNTGAVGTVNGVAFTLPNAVWICIHGTPVVADVAKAIWDSRQMGIPFDYGSAMGTPVQSPNGISVIDESSGRPYAVKYVTPIEYDGYVQIIISLGNSSATKEAIQSAVVSWAAGLVDGEAGLVVGASLSAFEVSGAVCRVFPSAYVKSCKVAGAQKGAAAPVPGAYVYEVYVAPFQVMDIQAGNVQVTFV